MTTLVGGSEQAGNTLDVLAFRDIFVTSFDLHVVVNCFLPDILRSFQHRSMCNTHQQKYQNTPFDFFLALFH